MHSEPLLATAGDAQQQLIPCSAFRRILLSLSLLVGAGFLAWRQVWLFPSRIEVSTQQWTPPTPQPRCEWVVAQIRARDVGRSHEQLLKKYSTVSEDYNSFYRGTAHMFWEDFVRGGWGNFDLASLGIESTLADGSQLQRTSTWTWITGDQHLSNFGAWKNRHGDVVFGVNDFDEAVVYDFQMDVIRLAVSIYDHAISNGLSQSKARAAVLTLADSYIDALQSYVGNEKALLYELTPQLATGELAAFLRSVDEENSRHKLLDKYTVLDKSSGSRRLIKNADTKLEAVSAAVEAEILRAFSQEGYGSTLTKIGWHAKEWDETFFKVLDVAARVGSGVGSYGVKRYYVLLNGSDGPLDSDGEHSGIILDVKYEPPPAFAKVVNSYDLGWYRQLFTNEAFRAVKAQRKLTSYTDPFTGWVSINGSAFVVRQRSPWKAGFDLARLSSYASFAEFVDHIAKITATSHARGSNPGAAPAQFKEVIASALGSTYARATWGVTVVESAAAYRKQVLLDFECFQEYVSKNFEPAKIALARAEMALRKADHLDDADEVS